MEKWLTTSVPGVLVLSVLGSIIAVILLNLIGKRLYPLLRKYAETMPKSALRWLYYGFLVSSIRGVVHTKQIWMISYLICGAIVIQMALAASTIHESEQILNNSGHIQLTRPYTQPADTQPMPAENTALESEIHDIANRARHDWAFFFGMLTYAIIWSLYLGTLRTIAFEYERLMVRLPGVVTKDEFRSLCRLEMEVSNRANLVPFLRELYRLTKQYQLKTFFMPIEFLHDHSAEGSIEC